jgi:hypothetical protein
MNKLLIALALIASIGSVSSLYISGLQGQQFHFDGQSNLPYNLISTHTVQINGQLSHIEKSKGVCNYTDTPCFSHAGTYITELGLTIASIPTTTQLRLISGSHEQGITLMIVENGIQRPLTLKRRLILTTNDQYHPSILRVGVNVIVINTLFFKMTVSNSDGFFNLAIAMHDDNLMRHGAVKMTICAGDMTGNDGVGMVGGPAYPTVPIHGVIGQTWKNAVYCANRLYEGEWEDYQINNLFDNDFRYNQYQDEVKEKEATTSN